MSTVPLGKETRLERNDTVAMAQMKLKSEELATKWTEITVQADETRKQAKAALEKGNRAQAAACLRRENQILAKRKIIEGAQSTLEESLAALDSVRIYLPHTVRAKKNI